MKYAHGIVSEYLAEDLSKQLAQYMNIPDEVDGKKRKLSNPKVEPDEKRPKKDSLKESPAPKAKMKELTKPEKVKHFSANNVISININFINLMFMFTVISDNFHHKTVQHNCLFLFRITDNGKI